MQRIHHGENIGRHQLIRVGLRIASAAAVTTAIDQDGAIDALDQ